MSNKHFKLRTDLSIELEGVTLFRIEATRDIKQRSVKAGDLGGYVEKEENLCDNAWVFGDAKVYGNAWVGENAQVFDHARVSGNAQVSGNAGVADRAWVFGDSRVYDNAEVYGDAEVFGDAEVNGNARVSVDKIKRPSDCKNIINEEYNITILPEFLQIGCQFHTKKEWWNFTDREILEMDGKDGLRWWKKWKPILMAICDAESEGEDENNN